MKNEPKTEKGSRGLLERDVQGGSGIVISKVF